MNVTRPSVKKRLTFRRFLMAVLLGIVAWYLAGWWLEPKPLWRMHFSSGQPFFVPLSESTEGRRFTAFEVKPEPTQQGVFPILSMNILDVETGKVLHRLPLEQEEIAGTDYYEFQQATPRIAGDKLWRIRIKRDNDTKTYELRSWRYEHESQEKVIRTWKEQRSNDFHISFSTPSSNRFVTRQIFPWEVMLTTWGTDGWSRLIHCLGCGPLGEAPPPFGSNTPPPPPTTPSSPVAQRSKGFLLPWIQTWKLPEQSESIEPLASWMLPPMKLAWPPAVSPDLRWIAFGDVSFSVFNPYPQNETENGSPKGVLLYEGNTGRPVLLNLSPDLLYQVDAAGDWLIPNQPMLQGDAGPTPGVFHFIEGSTGGMVMPPAELAKNFVPSLFATDVQSPKRMLLMTNISDKGMGSFMSPTGDTSAITMAVVEKTELHALRLVSKAELQSLPAMAYLTYTHFAGNEVGLFTLEDSAPPLLRTLGQKWDWLGKQIDNWWPAPRNSINLFDVRTGQFLWSLRNETSAMVFASGHPEKHLYTETNGSDPTQGFASLAAWKLPLMPPLYSPWYPHLAGFVVFLLSIILLRRKVAAGRP